MPPKVAPPRQKTALYLAYLHHSWMENKLSEQVIDSFREQAKNLPGPVFVHCASGKRSGAMVIDGLRRRAGDVRR